MVGPWKKHLAHSAEGRFLAEGWLKAAVKHLNKPNESIITVLKKNLEGYKVGRPRTVLHASDVTKDGFCPRLEAFLDLEEKPLSPGMYTPAALQATFDVGSALERLIVEEWGGESIIGNWRCRICGKSATMCSKPGLQNGTHLHDWEYMQWPAVSNEYGISGSVDSLWALGTPLWMMAELKIMAPDEFASIVAPLSEHRIRTNLYMKIIGDSDSPYKDRVNLHEARVMYTSRAYGKKNDVHGGEILPWKEFVVERNDKDLVQILDRAKQLKVFRQEQKMPAGICATALDKRAKKCDQCQLCFSGKHPAQQPDLLSF
jgi:hypothetical protein